MQAWLTTMFERHGGRYVIGCGIAVALATLVVAVPAIAAFPSHYEGLTVAQYVRLVAISMGAAVLIFGILVWRHRTAIRALLRWSDTRDRESETEARRFAFDAPAQIGRFFVALAPVGIPIVVLLLGEPRHHTSAVDLLELTIGALTSVLMASINVWFTIDVLMRPIRRALEGPAPDARPESLVGRLALAVPATIWLSSFAVGYMTTTRARAGAGHLLVVYAIAVVCVLLSLALAAPLFIGAVATPIRDLARATRDIVGGRLDSRVPVTSSDELGRLAQSFNDMLDELQASRVRIVRAADAARRDVERDLHDGAQQRLVLLKLKLSLLKREPTRTELIDELSTELDHALVELRDLARGLYPARLESDGLPGALADVAQSAPIPTTVQSNGTGRFPAETEAAVYFCCLEALQNAAKHAGEGATARILLAARPGGLEFEVADDGAGFDPVSIESSSGFQNMRDRIGALGGELTVTSAPGRGTTIAGRVPLLADGDGRQDRPSPSA